VVKKPIDEEPFDKEDDVPVEAIEQEPLEPVDVFVKPAAGVRALRERLAAGSKRGTVRLTRALTRLEAEYERMEKPAATAADDDEPEE
jgi:hypothetical protein